MILVKKNYKNRRFGHIWPIYYRTISQFLPGGTICPNKDAIKRILRRLTSFNGQREHTFNQLDATVDRCWTQPSVNAMLLKSFAVFECDFVSVDITSGPGYISALSYPSTAD